MSSSSSGIKVTYLLRQRTEKKEGNQYHINVYMLSLWLTQNHSCQYISLPISSSYTVSERQHISEVAKNKEGLS